MKLCKDCKYCTPFRHDGETIFHHCRLKSPKHDIDPVEGIVYYNSLTAVRCVDERRNSTGFFGLFIDKDRCGVEAQNFEPRINQQLEENNESSDSHQSTQYPP